MNTPSNRTGHGMDGFSMIELLVVLVLLAIMSSMAVPSMTAYVDRTKTRRSLDRLVADVSYARILSVQQGRRHSISVTEAGVYTVSALDESGNWVTLKTVDLGADYPGLSVSGGLTTLEFSSRGLLQSTAVGDGFIKVSRGGVRDSVFVSPAGRVYRAF